MLLAAFTGGFVLNKAVCAVRCESFSFPCLPAVRELSSTMCTVTFIIQPVLQLSLLCCPSVTIPSLLAVDALLLLWHWVRIKSRYI